MSKVISRSIKCTGMGDNYLINIVQTKDNGKKAYIKEELTAQELVDSEKANVSAVMQMEMAQLKPMKEIISLVKEHPEFEKLICILKNTANLDKIRNDIKTIQSKIDKIKADNKKLQPSLLKANRYLSDKRGEKK